MTDHIIPDPTKPPTDPPLLGDPQIDWNDDAKILVSSALSMVPQVGGILSGLVKIFWPNDQPSPWDQVKTQVEALVQQDIAAEVYQNVSDDLGGLTPIPYGLIGYITLYLNELKTGTPELILERWGDARGAFVGALGHFREKGYELPLLGLFSQFANLYLSLLRDPLLPKERGFEELTGTSWGMPDGDIQQLRTDLQNAIADFIDWPNYFVLQHLQDLKVATKPNYELCQPFRTVNSYVSGITTMVLDYQDMWPYYDVTKYPNGSTASFTREIYSQPYGRCYNSGDIVLALPVPTQLPTGIVVWSSDRIDGVQVTYPAGSGPGGMTQTARMGNQSGGSGTSIVPIPGIPITAARASVSSWYDGNYFNTPDYLLAQIQFGFADGGTTDVLGTNDGAYDQVGYWSDWVGFPNRALSRVHVNGVNKRTGTADCVVFGFAPWTDPKMSLRAVKTLYITSPKEQSMADLAKAHPKVAIPADLITDELKAARKAYWADVEARAKALK
ncbi:insecticidal delta-endotoxin Cry8Ea1 family protein [Spirosoma jeollabukense]